MAKSKGVATQRCACWFTGQALVFTFCPSSVEPIYGDIHDLVLPSLGCTTSEEKVKTENWKEWHGGVRTRILGTSTVLAYL